MDYAAARHAMVESQIRTNRVNDPEIVAAFDEVPRELFVPAPLRGIAYVDDALPLGHGRHLMEPLALAQLLQAAAIKPGDVVLDVGCGTGYSTAILSRLAATVVALEEVGAFVQEANRLLGELTSHNTAVIEGPLAAGYAKQAPYDAIIVEGGVQDLPDAIVEQLGEGGRLAYVQVGDGGFGTGTLVTRTGGTLTRRAVFDIGTPVLPGFVRRPSFAF